MKFASMVTNASFGQIRAIVLPLTLALLAASCTGCTAVGQRISGMYNAVLTHCQVRHDLAEVRQDTREALMEEEIRSRKLAAQREVEAARYAAERERLEMQFCQANQEAAQRRVKSHIKESLESKVAFNVEHGLELGEIEVDVESLQSLIKKREEEAAKRPPPPPPEAGKRPCSCCDQLCGCEPGLIRRLCPHCRHKPCEAEKNCGGPEAVARLEQEAAKRPLRPAEIPLKIPVRLTFGMQGPEMESARIRRRPDVPESEEGRRPCTQPCLDPNGPCTQPIPGQKPAGNAPPAVPLPPEPVVEPQAPPKPVLDEEARRRRKLLPVLPAMSRLPKPEPQFAVREAERP
jgi:biopolymer transport protein ExbB/TolQ